MLGMEYCASVEALVMKETLATISSMVMVHIIMRPVRLMLVAGG